MNAFLPSAFFRGLGYNALTALPSEMTAFVGLTYIQLVKNALTAADPIGTFTKLKALFALDKQESFAHICTKEF